jgi:serine/threonine protein kinase
MDRDADPFADERVSVLEPLLPTANMSAPTRPEDHRSGGAPVSPGRQYKSESVVDLADAEPRSPFGPRLTFDIPVPSMTQSLEMLTPKAAGQSSWTRRNPDAPRSPARSPTGAAELAHGLQNQADLANAHLLCSALHVWLHGLGEQFAGAWQRALEAEAVIRQLKHGSCGTDRVIQAVTDTVAAMPADPDSPAAVMASSSSWKAALISLVTTISTMIETHAVAARHPSAARTLSQIPRPPALRARSATVMHRAKRQPQQPEEEEEPPKSPLVGLRDVDSQCSLLSLPAVAAPTSTGNAFMNDDFDDGTIELNQYVLFERLGQGAQGEVFLASDTSKKELRAIKAVRRPRGAKGPASPNTSTAVGAVAAARQRQRDQLEREVLAMKKLRHRNVVRLYEVIDDPELERMYLVMQYVEHGPVVTLTPEGVASRTIEPKKMVSFARQICAGLEYLHKKGVIHRDIKPDNILLGHDDCVYLADFGTAEVFGEADAQRGVTGTRGTMAFLAPELLAIDEDTDAPLLLRPPVNGEAVDVWALGVTFYVMLYGKLPWEFGDARQLFKHIEKSPLTFHRTPGMSSASSHELLPPRSHMAVPEGRVSPPLIHTSSPQSNSEVPELPSFTVDGEGMDTVDSDDDLIDTTNTPPSHLLTSPSPGGSLKVEWRRILRGMLEKSPARRSTIRQVRRKLAVMSDKTGAWGASVADYDAITTLLRGSN